jgi:hypothetical protein
MPNTSSASWTTFVPGTRARATEANGNFDFSEHHLWPHAAGVPADNTYDLGNSTTAYWRTAWLRSINATSTAAGLAIGTTTAHTSALVEFAGTKALLIPRLTTVQRDALTSANGMFIYNSTDEQFQKYENGGWAAMGGAVIGFAFPVAASTTSSATGTVLSITAPGRLLRVGQIAETTANNNRLTLVIDNINYGELTGTGTANTFLQMPANVSGATATTFALTTTSDLVHELDMFFKTGVSVYHRSNNNTGVVGTKVYYERT